MAKTDWNLRDTIRPEDMNELGHEINEHGGKIAEQGLEIDEHDKTILEQGAEITEQGKSISTLENRLNTEEYAEITLQPGLQVVKAERDARFRLGSIKGRTLINLLGSAGGCEDVNAFQLSSTNPPTVDSSIYKFGSKSIRISANGTTSYFSKSFTIDVTKKCVLAVDIYIKSISNGRVGIRVARNDYGIISTAYADGEKLNQWQTVFIPVDSSSITDSLLRVVCGALENGSVVTANYDGIRLYYVGQSEYEELLTMTHEYFNLKYPFVSVGVIGVENPYVIRYGENLLPPFYEWSNTKNLKIISPCRATLKATAAFHINRCRLRLPAGNVYTLSGEFSGDVGGYLHARAYDLSGTIMPSLNGSTSQSQLGMNTLTFTVPVGAVFVEVVFTSTKMGTFTLEKPTLVVGSRPKSLEPRENSMLAFQTDLHSNPIDGSESDELFESNGEYFKLMKWKKVVLDGTLSWDRGSNFTSFKTVRLAKFIPNSLTALPYATKYDGLSLAKTINQPDCCWIDVSNGNTFVGIANKDSGWGDSYTPTIDEIKAYFMGWRMANPDNWGVPYPGTGIKAWGRIDKNGDLIQASGTINLPTILNTEGGYKPYNLLYPLAKQTVKPVVFEGSLTTFKGDNVVDVGVGIEVREEVTPALFSEGGINYYWINDFAVDDAVGSYSVLKHSTNEMLKIYVDSKEDTNNWTFLADHDNAPQKGMIGFVEDYNYDKSATYSVTYLRMDQSSISPISGILAMKEKAQLSDMTAGIAEALYSISVLRNNKAEKIAPGWINPTLLNNWVNSENGNNPVGYYKDNSNIVRLRGNINKGVTNAWTSIFVLPINYRPGFNSGYPVASTNSSGNIVFGTIFVASDGNVSIFAGGNGGLSLDGISFLAEQ